MNTKVLRRIVMLVIGATPILLSHPTAAGQTLPPDSLYQLRDSLLYTLDEVVVTGTGTQHYLKNAPVQTEVISRKTLDSYGGASLVDILSGLLPGVDFSHSDMGTAMQMGGLGGSYVLILVDGKKLMSDSGGQADLSVIDPTRIERIEVVKGAASALYGSDAIAGVINIITHNPKEDYAVTNSSRIGSYGSIVQSNAVQWGVGEFTSLTDFTLKHSDGWQNTTCEDPNRYEKPITNSVNKTSNEYTDWKIGQHFYYSPLPNLSTYAEGSFYRKDIYRPTGIPDYKTYNFRYRNASAAVGARWQMMGGHVLTADVRYNMHAYYYVYTGETWATEFGKDGKETSYPYFPGDISLQSNQQRLLTHIKGVFALPYDNRLSGGVELENNWLVAPFRLDQDRISDLNGAIYAQDEWTPTRHFNVTAGARLTYHPSFGIKFTPKISALYKIGPVNLRASYSEGFKTPTIKELHYRYVRQMAMIILNLGNKNLQPQTSRYVSGGVEYNGERISLNVTGYGNFLDRMITLVTIPNVEAPADILIMYRPNRVRQYKNMDRAKNFGVDINGKWRIVDQLVLSAGYSYLDTQAHLYDDEKKEMRTVTIDGMAHHRGTVGLSWSRPFARNKYRLGLGLYGRMQSTRYYQDDGNGKPYQLWRLNTQHDLTLSNNWKLKIDAGIDNVFNYYETTYHGLHYGTNTPGRTFYISLSIFFGKDRKVKYKSSKSYRRSEATDSNDEE